MLKYLNILKNHPLLSDVSEKHIKDVLAHAKLTELKKKTVLYSEGSSDSNIYFLFKGAARGYSNYGDRQIVDFFYTENSFIGNIDSIFMDMPSQLTVEAITPCIVFSFSKHVLFEKIKLYPDIQFKIYEILVSHISSHEERVKLLTQYAVASKSYLKFRELYGPIADVFPNKDVASYLGITAEALTRIKKSLKNKFSSVQEQCIV